MHATGVGPRTIASPANPLLKEVRRAAERGALTEEGCCVAESFHLLEEALRSGCEVPWVLVTESAREPIEGLMSGREASQIAVLPDALFRSVATTETSQGAIALVRPPVWSLAQLFGGSSLVLILDGVQDPGNVGTILRSAEAFGATGAMFLKGTAGPFNPKTLRASAGSVFRVPFIAGLDAREALASIGERSVTLYAAMPRAPRLVAETDFTRPCAIVIGGESRGIGPELGTQAEPVAIPTIGVESLNAAMAASILLYEAQRQRFRA
jgi:RNA methyltransferase, TrmH family